MNFHVKAKIQINLLDFSCQNPDANVFIWFYLSKHKIKINFLDFFCQKGTLIWKNILSNLWMLTRLIYLVKTQIQILFFEFSRQNIILNDFAGFPSKCNFKLIIWIFLAKFFLPNFFLSKHRCKWIYLILPVKTQN